MFSHFFVADEEKMLIVCKDNMFLSILANYFPYVYDLCCFVAAHGVHILQVIKSNSISTRAQHIFVVLSDTDFIDEIAVA